MTAVLVFGARGQVAQELAKIGPSLGLEPTLAGRETVDLERDDGAGLIAALSATGRPALVINAAAYTAVDKAEQPDQHAAAFRLNAEIPGALARSCAAAGIPFVHLSTDYVFDGAKPTPYVEDDPRRPLGVYGRSKAEGEAAVEAAGGRFAVVRTAWVYSAFAANFMKTMLRLAGQREELGVVADQVGCPTWAEDVARAALLLGQAMLRGEAAAQGLFHAAGEGEASWADFAEAIFAESAARGGPSARVRRITTADYPTPARRPANSRLAGERLQTAVGWRPPPWRQSLAACLAALPRA